MTRPSQVSLALLSLSTALLLAGCGAGVPSTVEEPVSLHLSGTVFGGQQPVYGATVQLYAVGTSGNGSASAALLSSTVTTSARGGFNITGKYSCSNATQVYLVATGGSSGSGTNSNIALATALGACSSLTSSTFISINELTTIAAAYALAPFEGSSYTSIGSSSSLVNGLANAFAASNVLVSSGSGLVGAAAPAGLAVPVAEINSLGDILASCINSAGSSSTGCSALFNVTGASNTFDAAFYIAKNPGSSAVLGLYNLVGSTSPFQPSLATTPKDFTVAAKYTGTTATPLSKPYGIAIDANGNALVTQQTGDTVVAISPLSSALTTSSTTAPGAGGLSGPAGIAIDTIGSSWIANPGDNDVVELSSYSTALNFGNVYSYKFPLTAGISNPVAIATDTNGNAYTLSPAENEAYAFVGFGAVSGSFVNASFAGQGALALSGAGTLAIGTGAGQICSSTFSNSGSTTTFASPTCTTQGSSGAIAALGFNTSGSSAGYVTTIANGSNSDGAYGPSIGTGPFTGGGLSAPTAIVFDSAGYAYIANATSLSQEFSSGSFHTAISPSGGYGTLSAPQGIAVDESGNIWTANSGDNSVSIFVGLANPTLTPIAANLH